MTRATLITVIGLFLIAANACSTPDQNSGAPSPATVASPAAKKVTSESVVKVTAQPVQVSAGGTADATVRIEIQNGYHVNANPPTFSYLKATTLEIPSGDGIAAGPVAYPKGMDKQFAFAEKPLAIYEGAVDLKATLKADKAAQPGERSLPAHLRIQACDDQVCYPPGTLELSIPVTINSIPMITR